MLTIVPAHCNGWIYPCSSRPDFLPEVQDFIAHSLGILTRSQLDTSSLIVTNLNSKSPSELMASSSFPFLSFKCHDVILDFSLVISHIKSCWLGTVSRIIHHSSPCRDCHQLSSRAGTAAICLSPPWSPCPDPQLYAFNMTEGSFERLRSDHTTPLFKALQWLPL